MNDHGTHECRSETMADRPSRQIFTIGHSSQPLDAFIGLLQTQGIDVLADVRSQPYSRFAPQFNAAELKQALKLVNLDYVPMGESLGGRPRDPGCYDDEGHVLYRRVSESATFKQGIDRLLQGIEKYRVAIMCSEENPEGCHRRLLVARVLIDQGVAVLHLRADGRVEPETNLINDTLPGDQLGLFQDEEPRDAWRSIRSVLPGRPRKNSSES